MTGTAPAGLGPPAPGKAPGTGAGAWSVSLGSVASGSSPSRRTLPVASSQVRVTGDVPEAVAGVSPGRAQV